MRPVSRRHSRRGLVGGSTFRRTPISRSPLDKNPMPGHLSELQPVNEVNTKGQFFRDRKSTRLNSSHQKISYAVFCLKKKKTKNLTKVQTKQHKKADAKATPNGLQ